MDVFVVFVWPWGQDHQRMLSIHETVEGAMASQPDAEWEKTPDSAGDFVWRSGDLEIERYKVAP